MGSAEYSDDSFYVSQILSFKELIILINNYKLEYNRNGETIQLEYFGTRHEGEVQP